MTAAMLIPTLGALGLLAAGLIANADTLFLLDHAIMLPSMLAAMLVRRDEYSAHRPVFVGRQLRDREPAGRNGDSGETSAHGAVSE
jgi:hypothetical protein